MVGAPISRQTLALDPNHRVPSVDECVRRTLANVDFSKPAVVLFLKGIGDDADWEHDGRRKVEPYLDARSTDLTEVLYDNLNAPVEGMAHGQQVLARVVAEIKRRRPTMHVHLAGVSLGAWTIGDTLGDNAAVRQAVDGAALFAHSAPAKHHYPVGAGPVREYNYPGDLFTEPFHGSREQMIAVLQRLYKHMSIGNVLVSLPVLVPNLKLFLQFQKWIAGKHTPHNDTDLLFPEAYTWMAGQIANELASDTVGAAAMARRAARNTR